MMSLFRSAVAVSFALVLAACLPERDVVPPYYADLGRAGTAIDAASARQIISSYRQSNGRAPLVLDPVLAQVAQRQANAMAAANSVRASLERDKTLAARMAAAGQTQTYAVENVSAGYRTLAEAFSGWRDSPKHNAVMLDETVTRMGIATAYAPGSKYRVFWSLVLAGPAP